MSEFHKSIEFPGLVLCLRIWTCKWVPDKLWTDEIWRRIIITLISGSQKESINGCRSVLVASTVNVHRVGGVASSCGFVCGWRRRRKVSCLVERQSELGFRSTIWNLEPKLNKLWSGEILIPEQGVKLEENKHALQMDILLLNPMLTSLCWLKVTRCCMSP